MGISTRAARRSHAVGGGQALRRGERLGGR